MEPVRISACGVYRYRVPLVAPLPLKGVTLYAREGLVLCVRDAEGNHGWGEVAPLPGFSLETLADARQQVLNLRTSLVGKSIDKRSLREDGSLRQVVKAVYPSVRFGMGLACADLWAKHHQKRLPEALQPTPHSTVALNSLLVDRGGAVDAQVARLRAGEYRALKLKVGRRSVEDDVARTRQIAALLGSEMGLRLDANRAWTLEQALTFADGVRDCQIAYIEEPLADPSNLPTFVAQSNMPVALDESLVGMSPSELRAHDYAVAVILKPTLASGWWSTIVWLQTAEALGMQAVLSASFETGVGLRGLVALAASFGQIDRPMGFDTYRWIASDLLIPRLPITTATIDVPTLFDGAYVLNTAYLEEIG